MNLQSDFFPSEKTDSTKSYLRRVQKEFLRQRVCFVFERAIGNYVTTWQQILMSF